MMGGLSLLGNRAVLAHPNGLHEGPEGLVDMRHHGVPLQRRDLGVLRHAGVEGIVRALVGRVLAVLHDASTRVISRCRLAGETWALAVRAHPHPVAHLLAHRSESSDLFLDERTRTKASRRAACSGLAV